MTEDDIFQKVLHDATIGKHGAGHGETTSHISFYMTGEKGALLILEAAKKYPQLLKRIQDLIESNNALLMRARLAEQALSERD